MSSSDHALHQLNLHRTVFENLVDRAESELASGEADVAASMLAIAADVASRNHPGRYTDDRFERAVAQLAARHVVDDTAGPSRKSQPEQDSATEFDGERAVVHVVSAEMTRGVEETVSRWEQHGQFRSVVVSSEGSESLLVRAARLRRELEQAVTVVLHAEPADIVPLLALGSFDRPPVVFVNHHETVFWPGVSIADLVVSHRATGSALAVDRRCLPVGRTMTLPPLRAEADVWSTVLGMIHDRASEVTPALPPPPLLPRPIEERDRELLRALSNADRSDGLLGALHRHGQDLPNACRPGLTVIVLAHDPDRAVEALHTALDSWTSYGSVQLVVVDRCGSTEMAGVLDELTGTVVGVRSHLTTDAQAVRDGLKWAWGTHAVVMSEDDEPMVGSWEIAMSLLDEDPSRVVVPIVGMSEHKPDGVLIRVDAPGLAIEQVFGTANRDPSVRGASPRLISARTTAPTPGDH